MKRLSIIIPMYNVESFVERCLRSLEDQDISGNDYEIICINDGSPDNSREIVTRLQKEFDNIVLIDQENQGVSRARNNGINRACGKYLLFIDPDDYIDANSISRILNSADKQKAQVVFLGFVFLKEDGTIQRQIFYENLKSQIYVGTNAYFISRGDGHTDPDRMWAVLFEREFLNRHNLRYLPDVPYLEDGEFIARILCLTERCIFDSNSFYQRTTRPGSATNSRLFYSEKSTKGFLKAASNLRRFREEQELNERQKEFLNQPLVKFVLLAVHSSIGWGKRKKLADTVKTLRSLGFWYINTKGCNQYYILNGRAYNFSPFLSTVTLILYWRIRRLYHVFF